MDCRRFNFFFNYWFVATIVIQSSVQIAVKSNIVTSYKIPSGAMKPTIKIGDPYQEDYIIYTDSNVFPKNEQPRDNFGPVKIPEDSLFVMGDNRDQSYDSRFWGFVKKSSVKGRIKGIYWSWDKENSRVRWDRIGKKVN